MQEMHNWFEQINTQDMHPSTLFEKLSNKLGITKTNPLYVAGLSISKQADNDTMAAYHNYIHTSEAMAAMYELAVHEFKDASPDTIFSAGVKTKQELIMTAVITMAGHDILHDGLAERISPPGSTDEYKQIQANRLEIQSAQKLENLCQNTGLTQQTINLMTTAIHGTAVKNTTLLEQNRTDYKTNPTSVKNAITQLATEADLAASISHIYGPHKGALFAIEATNSENHALAAGLTSEKGRVWFLQNACHLLSTGAKSTGLLDELNNMDLQLAGIEAYNKTKNEISTTMGVYEKLGLANKSDKPNSLTTTNTLHAVKEKLNTTIDGQELNFSL